MDFKKYDNLLPYPSRKSDPNYDNRLGAYRDMQHRLMMKFEDDALTEVGLADHPKKHVIYSKAWQDGHSGGMSEVFGHLLDLAEFISDLER